MDGPRLVHRSWWSQRARALAINQQADPDDFADRGAAWEDLGVLHVITTDTLTVRLSNLANGFVIADAGHRTNLKNEEHPKLDPVGMISE